MDRLERLEAKTEIQEVLFRYARGVDRKDWELVRSCFHPDARDRHGEFEGGPEDFIAWVDARHRTIPFAAHFMGNCLIELADAGTALVETYFHAIQQHPGEGRDADEQLRQVFGRYCDRFEKRGALWRVARRQVVYDGVVTLTAPPHAPFPPGSTGARDASDPVYTLLRGS